MNSLLSIGQFAKLCNTSKDTLIHYDEIGLLHPCQVGENHYRLYSATQCQTFHMIRLLAEHNVPLPDIKELLNSNSLNTLLQHLTEKRKELLRQKQYLEGAILHLDDLLQLQSILSSSISEPILINQPYPQDFFVTNFPSPTPNFKQISQTLGTHFMRCYENGLYPYPVTYIIKKESLTARNYIPYLIASPVSPGNTDIYTYRKPEISYVVISHSGSLYTVNHSIEKALTFINENQLRMIGNFYISDFSNFIPSDNSTIYIIQIAVKEC